MTEAEKNYQAGSLFRSEVHKEINANKIYIDRSAFKKTPSEQVELSTVKSNFRRNGLREWNDRNRPDNNKRLI